MDVHESGQDYLERILMIQKEKGHVRNIDIANALNFSRPSVTIALKKLKNDGYIVINDGLITLTDEGYNIASKILERHEIISSLLMELGIDKTTALEDACKIEHDLSETTFQAIKEHYQKILAKKEQ